MALILGIAYGLLITLIDQIIEHSLVRNKVIKFFLSYFFVLLILLLIYYIVIYFYNIIPFLIGLNIYWLLVGKIHDTQFKVYIIGFLLILLFFYIFTYNDIYLIIFTLGANLFFKIKYIKNLLHKSKLGLFLYRFLGRGYIISILIYVIFSNLNICLFNIGSTFISFIIAKKYILNQK